MCCGDELLSLLKTITKKHAKKQQNETKRNATQQKYSVSYPPIKHINIASYNFTDLDDHIFVRVRIFLFYSFFVVRLHTMCYIYSKCACVPFQKNFIGHRKLSTSAAQ